MTKVEDMWLKELDSLEKVYLEYILERDQLSRDDIVKKKHVVKVTKKKLLVEE
jgi:hypothetical protein